MKFRANSLLFSLLIIPNMSATQELDSGAIRVILDTSNEICGEYFISGNRSRQSFTGAASGHVRGLAKVLAEVGAEGDFELDEEEYLNVLHGELGTSLKDSRDCRVKVWNDLKAAAIRE